MITATECVSAGSHPETIRLDVLPFHASSMAYVFRSYDSKSGLAVAIYNGVRDKHNGSDYLGADRDTPTRDLEKLEGEGIALLQAVSPVVFIISSRKVSSRLVCSRCRDVWPMIIWASKLFELYAPALQ